MPKLATDAKPGEIRIVDGNAKIALVGFDKEGNTCLKWYIPKTGRDIRAARRYMQGYKN
jgi:hypothetical protein